MLIAALMLNVTVLMPILVLLARGSAAMGAVYGPDTPARRILICVYGAITMGSAALVVVLTLEVPGAHDWTRALLAGQILYKGMTVPALGLGHPVVRVNLGIAMVHAMILGQA